MKRWILIGAMVACQQASALTISEAVDVAANNDPALQAELKRLSADATRVPEVRAALMPQMSLTAEREFRDRRLPEDGDGGFQTVGSSIGWDRNSQVELELSQVLFNPLLTREVAQAKAEVQVSIARFEVSRLDLIQEVVADYIAALKQAEAVELVDEEIAAVKEALRLAWARYLDGTARETEALQAEARVLSVQAERRRAEIALQELLGALAKRVNQPPSRLFALPSGALVKSEYGINDALSTQASPELVLTRRSVEQATAAVRTARGAYSPELSLRITESRQNDYRVNRDGVQQDDIRDTSVALQFRWDFMDGGARLSREGRAKFGLQAAELDDANQIRLVNERVRIGRLELAQAKTNLESLSSVESALARVAREQSEAFSAGLIDATTALDAQRDLARAKSQTSSAKYDVILAELNLRRTTGQLDMDYLRQLEGQLTQVVNLGS